MSVIDPNTHICDIVSENPLTARIFIDKGMDFCCGGAVPLNQVCQEKALDVDELIREIDQVGSDVGEFHITEATRATDIIEFILAQFHQVHRIEFPTLNYLSEKVARVHGVAHPELLELQSCWNRLYNEMVLHMEKEERVLFPLIQSLESSEAAGPGPAPFHCGSIEGPVGQMEREHDEVGDILKQMRELTSGYTLPEDACRSYQSLFAGLAKFERDVMLHVHMENHHLHPRARTLGAALR